jgi:hypothetical protein
MFTNSSPGLLITSPAAGALVAPGQNLSVSLSSPAGLSFTNLYVLGEDALGSATAAGSTPATLTLVIPIDAPLGFASLSAIGLTSNGEAESAPVQVDVERTDVPVSLSFENSQVNLDSIGQAAALNVQANYADGTVADATLSSRISFSSTNSSVANVNAEGSVTAVHAGGCTIVVTYTPPSGTALMLAIPVNVSNPLLAPSNSLLDFGSVSIGATSTSQEITLTNNGSSALNFVSIYSSGDFAQTNTCQSTTPLAPGTTCRVDISFTPSVAGAQTGFITVKTDQESLPTVISLAGTGI